MYRYQQQQEQIKMEEQQFFDRLGSLPVVNTAWSQACDLYLKTKERNALLRLTLGMAESSVKTVAGTTKPLVEKYQPQVQQVNSYACKQLSKLEESYPVITKPTEEVIQDGKEKCQAILKPAVDRVTAVRQYSTDTYNGVINRGKEKVESVKEIGVNTITEVKDFGMAQINKTLETPYGKYVTEKVDDVLTYSEEYVDKYLPPTESEEDDDDDDESDEEDEAPRSPVSRVATLSTKVRQRMHKRALRDLKGVQMRSHEVLAKLNFTVDLIQYAKSNLDSAKSHLSETVDAAQEKARYVWDEITSDEEYVEVPNSLEGQTIAVARHLTQQLKHGVTTVTTYLPESVQPAALQERLQQARKYTEDLYHSFRDASSFEDIPQWALAQTKEKLAYLQETLSFVTEQLLAKPLSWLMPGRRQVKEAPETHDEQVYME